MGSHGAARHPRRVEIWLLLGIALLHNLDRTIMSGLLQPIKTTFDLSDAAVGALSGVGFGLAYATLGLPFARLADTLDRRRILAVALAVWSAFTCLCGLAGGFWAFFAARLAVGLCEAAGAPAMHALAADKFSAARRSSAASLMAVGATLGAMIGISGGGVIAEHFGWRTAFLLAGVPGLIVAPLVWAKLRDPRPPSPRVRLGELFGGTMLRSCWALLAKPGFRLVMLGAAAMAFWLWGTATWFITFLVRSHDMSLAQASLGYGLLSGVSTLAGAAASGFVGDRLARRDPRWLGWLPALAILGCLALALPVYFVASGPVALGLYVAANIFTGLIAAAQFAAVYALAGPTLRAMGVALLSLVNYAVGLGVAAAAIGLVSDALAPRHGQDSLRLALMIAAAALPIAAFFFWRSTCHFDRDLADD